MNELESYDDPILAARTRDWMQASAPVAAPERLVFGVMDEVDRLPRQRRLAFPGLPILAGFVRYAALALVIAAGVAAGILVSRSVDNIGGPSPAPTPTPSLRFLGNLRDDGRLLTSDTAGAWLVTDGGQLLPITADGSVGEPITVGFTPTDLRAISGSSSDYGGPETVWLVAPDADLVRVDPTVGEIFSARDVRGTRVSLGAGAAWVSRAGEISRVLADLVSVTNYTFGAHRTDDPVLVTDNALWVGDPSGIVRMDLATGELGSRIPGAAAALVAADDRVWVAQGQRLVGIDSGTGAVALTASLQTNLPAIVALATHGDVVWLATGPGPQGSLLVGVDPSTGRTLSLTPLPTTPIAIAVVGTQVWTLDAAGSVGRFEPG